MSKPVTGVPAVFTVAVSVRGINTPLVVDLTSSMAELLGVEASVLMATWALRVSVVARVRSKKVNCFMIVLFMNFKFKIQSSRFKVCRAALGGSQIIYFAIKCSSRICLLRMLVAKYIFYESRLSVTK